MKLNALLMVNAVIAAAFGIAFVIVPGPLVALYGVTADAALRYVGQLLGAALVVLAVVTWLARNATDSDARRAIVLGLAIGSTVGFVVALLGQLGGVVNALGWSTVAIYLLLALGFAYFALRRPAPAA
jgi:quinol-cytochrome oxidoreductase complex cytochrome b subunit